MKVCTKCGMNLKNEMFYAKNGSKSGLQSWCIECCKNHGKLRNGTTGEYKTLDKVYSDKNLANFTPRQLIDELKQRGYTGELRYVQIIKL